MLLLQVSEVGTDGFGCELLLVVLEEHTTNGFELGEVQEGEVAEPLVPLGCVVAEEIGELIDFSLIGGPFPNAGGFAKSVQVISCREVILSFRLWNKGKAVDLLMRSCLDRLSKWFWSAGMLSVAGFIWLCGAALYQP